MESEQTREKPLHISVHGRGMLIIDNRADRTRSISTHSRQDFFHARSVRRKFAVKFINDFLRRSQEARSARIISKALPLLIYGLNVRYCKSMNGRERLHPCVVVRYYSCSMGQAKVSI